MKTVYEDVVKQPADKLAQTMQDMTYCWNETVVPKKTLQEAPHQTARGGCRGQR